jgi:hypothetical protein
MAYTESCKHILTWKAGYPILDYIMPTPLYFRTAWASFMILFYSYERISLLPNIKVILLMKLRKYAENLSTTVKSADEIRSNYIQNGHNI